jgi:CheY-like chemotaxis protein
MIVRRTTLPFAPSSFKALVADDCPANRRMFQALYQACGCAVTLAEDGAAALEAALTEDFALISLDRHMPYATGDEVARAIRASHPRSARPYLVLCTSDPRPGDAAGDFDAVLEKPVSPHDVVSVVAKALRSALAAAEHRRAQDRLRTENVDRGRLGA